MWIVETERRSHEKAAPKQEWAYIRFVQRFIKDYPLTSREDLMQEWVVERERHKNLVVKYLNYFFKEERSR